MSLCTTIVIRSTKVFQQQRVQHQQQIRQFVVVQTHRLRQTITGKFQQQQQYYTNQTISFQYCRNQQPQYPKLSLCCYNNGIHHFIVKTARSNRQPSIDTSIRRHYITSLSSSDVRQPPIIMSRRYDSLQSCDKTASRSHSRNYYYRQIYQHRPLQQYVAYFTTTTKQSTNSRKRSSNTTTDTIESEPDKNHGNDNTIIKKTTTTVPSFANIIIIGGGIIGTSVAYHCGQHILKHNNHSNNNSNNDDNNKVLLLEQNTLTSGTTWHAAGLINTFGSMSSTSTYMRQYTKDLYQNILPNITNMDTGFMDIGFIELACDVDRLYYYRKVAAYNRYCGINVQEITPQQIQDLFPACSIQDVLAGFYVQSDGRTNPTDTTYALAKAAKMTNHVQIMEHTPVKRIITRRKNLDQSLLSHVTGVELMDGTIINCDVVVNCAGMWSRQLGEANNIYCIPNQAAEHYYCITEPISHINPNYPVIEDSSKYVYIRPESGGLMLGLFEPMGASWNAKTDIPNDFAFGQIEPDWDRMAPYLEEAMKRVPCVQDVGIKSFFCGPESFTPDNQPVVGPVPMIQNYYVAAGLNSIGILTGGGIGKIIAEWVYNNGIAPSTVDVTSIHVNRFHKYQQNIQYRQQRVGEALGETYKVHYPDHQLQTCRNIKKSALHYQIQQQANPKFRSVSGWESPTWYAPSGYDHSTVPSNESFGREHWFQYWANEHNACRNDVALFDMTFMSKFLVQGCDAGTFLNYLSTANVNQQCGLITYTQWLNEHGYIEADVTIVKLDDDQFLVVATDTMHNHVYSHMMKRLNRKIHAYVTDVTPKYVQLNIQGPKSRELLQMMTTHDMSNINFPFRHVADIDFGLARVLCVRVTYVGELGYELYIPVEFSDYVYKRILELSSSSTQITLQHAGLRALGSLRMEKGYRDYGHDIDNTDTVLDAGLGFTCDFGKKDGFIGQDHVVIQKQLSKSQGGPSKRMVNVLVNDPEPLMHHGEILWRNNVRISDVRSASYGHTLGGAVGLSMLDRYQTKEPITKDFIHNGQWEIEIANQRYPCQLSFSPFYDPKGDRIKV